MKIMSLVVFSAMYWSSLHAADLPTISVEHLQYLRFRGEDLRRLSPEDMIDYCVTQKLGGRAFEDLYSQLFIMRVDLTKLQRIDGVSDDDSRVKTLKKTYAAEYSLLLDEAQRIQRGMVREGVIADETLGYITGRPGR